MERLVNVFEDEPEKGMKRDIDILGICLKLPDPSLVKLYMEPFVVGTIVFPDECMGKMLTLCEVRYIYIYIYIYISY